MMRLSASKRTFVRWDMLGEHGLETFTDHPDGLGDLVNGSQMH